MCAGCAVAAAAGASGIRSWLQTRDWSWLTARRLRRLTLAVCAAALIFSSFALTGSTHKPHHPARAAAVAAGP